MRIDKHAFSLDLQVVFVGHECCDARALSILTVRVMFDSFLKVVKIVAEDFFDFLAFLMTFSVCSTMMTTSGYVNFLLSLHGRALNSLEGLVVAPEMYWVLNLFASFWVCEGNALVIWLFRLVVD